MANNIIFRPSRLPVGVIIQHVQRRNMPVNVPPTATGKRRFRLAVETDPHKLVNYCCGLNYHIDEPPIKLKEDHEYPDWLWTLRLGPKPNSWEMEKGTKEYYLRLAEEGSTQNYLNKMQAAKPTKTVDKNILAKQDYIHHKRFAALAYLEDDIGLDSNTLEQDTIEPYALKKSDYYLPFNNNRVLYMDKIPGNINLKNYDPDLENSFNTGYKPMNKPQSIHRKKVLDNRQRHKYSVF